MRDSSSFTQTTTTATGTSDMRPKLFNEHSDLAPFFSEHRSLYSFFIIDVVIDVVVDYSPLEGP